jgi:hypothetical protein
MSLSWPSQDSVGFSVPLWPRLADKKYGHPHGPDSGRGDAPKERAVPRRRPPGAGPVVRWLGRPAAAHGRAPHGPQAAGPPRCL